MEYQRKYGEKTQNDMRDNIEEEDLSETAEGAINGQANITAEEDERLLAHNGKHITLYLVASMVIVGLFASHVFTESCISVLSSSPPF